MGCGDQEEIKASRLVYADYLGEHIGSNRRVLSPRVEAAVDRSHLMALTGALPVVIDNLTESEARVPDRFLRAPVAHRRKVKRRRNCRHPRLLETTAAGRPGSSQPSQSGPSVAPNAGDICEQPMAAQPYTASPARMVGVAELAALENRLKQAIWTTTVYVCERAAP